MKSLLYLYLLIIIYSSETLAQARFKNLLSFLVAGGNKAVGQDLHIFYRAQNDMVKSLRKGRVPLENILTFYSEGKETKFASQKKLSHHPMMGPMVIQHQFPTPLSVYATGASKLSDIEQGLTKAKNPYKNFLMVLNGHGDKDFGFGLSHQEEILSPEHYQKFTDQLDPQMQKILINSSCFSGIYLDQARPDRQIFTSSNRLKSCYVPASDKSEDLYSVLLVDKISKGSSLLEGHIEAAAINNFAESENFSQSDSFSDFLEKEIHVLAGREDSIAWLEESRVVDDGIFDPDDYYYGCDEDTLRKDTLGLDRSLRALTQGGQPLLLSTRVEPFGQKLTKEMDYLKKMKEMIQARESHQNSMKRVENFNFLTKEQKEKVEFIQEMANKKINATTSYLIELEFLRINRWRILWAKLDLLLNYGNREQILSLGKMLDGHLRTVD